MAINSVLQTIRNAEIDARSLSEFISKGASFTVTRRLAPTIHTLDYYLQVLNSVYDKGIQADTAISDTLDKLNTLEPIIISRVESAISNTAVDGGVLSDALVVVDGSINQRQINRGLESIADLSTINNPKDGLRVYVKSYHAGLGKGGGYFTYDSSKSSVNDGGTIVNGWIRDDSSSITPEMFGAKGDGITDDSEPLSKAALACRDLGLKLLCVSKNGYLIESNVEVFGDVEISKLIFRRSNDSSGNLVKFAVARNNQDEDEEIPISTLSGLDAFSSKIGGLPANARGRYMMINTNVDHQDRYNAGIVTTRKMLAVFRVLTAEGAITPSLYADFNGIADSDATVVLYAPEKYSEVRINDIAYIGEGVNLNATIEVHKENTKILIGNSSLSLGISTLLKVFANNVKIEGSLNGALVDGLGYAILLSRCCDTFINNVISGNSRSNLDCGEANNVFVTNSSFDRAGAHWANNLVFTNCNVGLYHFSGKDLSIYGGTTGGVAVRSDYLYASGKLIIKDVVSNGRYLLGSPTLSTANWAYPKKLFDHIQIENCEMRYDGTERVSLIELGRHQTYWQPPKSITVRDCHIEAKEATSVYALNLVTSYAKSHETDYPKNTIYNLDTITTSDNVMSMLFNIGGVWTNVINGTYKPSLTITNCKKVWVRASSNTLEHLKINNSEVICVEEANSNLKGFSRSFYTDCEFNKTSESTTLINLAGYRVYKLCHFRTPFVNDGIADYEVLIAGNTIEGNIANEDVPARILDRSEKVSLYTPAGQLIPKE